MLASLLMTGRSLLVLCLAAALFALGCSTHAPAAMAVDTPLVPYAAPDVDELVGEDLTADEEEPAEEPAAPAAPAASPTKPAQPGKTT
jgi:hypothetical protein